MVKLTRSKVAHDLNISPHILEVCYSEYSTIKFVFSSELYKDIFVGKMVENRETINQSLTNRFGFNIKNDKLSDLKLYSKTEKRGFLIYHNGVKIECLNNITLDGQTVIANS